MAYKDKQKQKQYMDEWREKRKDHIARYQEENSDKLKKATQKWRTKNPEHIKEYSKEYYKKHAEERRAYSKKYRENNKQVVKNKTKKWKENNRNYVQQKQYLYDNLRLYGGNKDIVLERDNHKCQICGSGDKLNIHHIDSNKKNNSIKNLISLCLSCHIELHHWQKREKLNAVLDFKLLEQKC